MVESDGVLNAQQRKKAARKQRKQKERLAHRDLDAATTAAVAEALRLAPIVANASTPADSERVIDVALTAAPEAHFVRKRVNDALKADEWLDEIAVWVWQADQHRRQPLSEAGRRSGVELRMEQRPR